MVQGEELGVRVLSRVRSLAGLTTWDRNRLSLRMLLQGLPTTVRIGGDTN
jgi:hypothetical protein